MATPAGFEDPKKTILTLEKVMVRMEKGIDKVLESHAHNIERNAKEAAPVKTGFLRANIRTSKINGGYMVGAYAHYSIFQEEGTSRIKAKYFFKNAVMAEKEAMESENLLDDIGLA